MYLGSSSGSQWAWRGNGGSGRKIDGDICCQIAVKIRKTSTQIRSSCTTRDLSCTGDRVSCSACRRGDSTRLVHWRLPMSFPCLKWPLIVHSVLCICAEVRQRCCMGCCTVVFLYSTFSDSTKTRFSRQERGQNTISDLQLTVDVADVIPHLFGAEHQA
jgi:hypothetical protein